MESVALFVTCLADMFQPQAAQAAVRVLERHGSAVTFPANQTCCGQFTFNAGYHREAAQLARHFIETFDGVSGPIVGLSGSCVVMVVREYPPLLEEAGREAGQSAATIKAWRQRAEAVAARTVEWTQWLARGETVTAASALARPVMHHLGCHMRRLLPETDSPAQICAMVGVRLVEPVEADQCCGFGGTYSMTEPAVSTALADAKWEAVLQRGAAEGALALTGEDLGCLLHLAGRQARQRGALPVLHIAELVDLAETGALTPETLQQVGRLTS